MRLLKKNVRVFGQLIRNPIRVIFVLSLCGISIDVFPRHVRVARHCPNLDDLMPKAIFRVERYMRHTKVKSYTDIRYLDLPMYFCLIYVYIDAFSNLRKKPVFREQPRGSCWICMCWFSCARLFGIEELCGKRIRQGSTPGDLVLGMFFCTRWQPWDANARVLFEASYSCKYPPGNKHIPFKGWDNDFPLRWDMLLVVSRGVEVSISTTLAWRELLKP